MFLSDLLEILRAMITPDDEFIELFIRWILQFEKSSIISFIKLYNKPNLIDRLPLYQPHKEDCPCSQYKEYKTVGQCITPYYTPPQSIIVPFSNLQEICLEKGTVYSCVIEPQKELLSGVHKKLFLECELESHSSSSVTLGEFLEDGNRDMLNVYDYILLTNLRNYVTLRKLEKYIPELYRSTDRGSLVNSVTISSILSCLSRLHSYTLRYQPQVTDHCFFKIPMFLPMVTQHPTLDNSSYILQEWKPKYDTNRYLRVVASNTVDHIILYDSMGRKLLQFPHLLNFPEYATLEILLCKETRTFHVLDVFIWEQELLLHLPYQKRIQKITHCKTLRILSNYDSHKLCLLRRNTTNHQTIVQKLIPSELELQIIQPPWSGFKKVKYGETISLTTLHHSKHYSKYTAIVILTKDFQVYSWGRNSLQYWCTLTFDQALTFCFERPLIYGHLNTHMLLVRVYFDSLSPIKINHLELAPHASIMDVCDCLNLTQSGMCKDAVQLKLGMFEHFKEFCSI